jgi:hypothetical protein
MNAGLTGTQRVALIATAIGVLLFWATLISDDKIMADAHQNLWMALNLRNSEVISLSESPPVVPSMQREPLPALVGALAVRAVDAVLGPAPAADYFYGKRAALLKYQNVLWLYVLSIAVFIVGLNLGLTFWPALLCVLVSNSLLLGEWYRICMLNSLLTESAAAAFLTLGSALLTIGSSANKLRWVVCAGVCFGLLALVKAAFLYVTLGLLLAIPGLSLLLRQPSRSAIVQAAVLTGTAALVVLPWMLRNYSSIGYFEIAGRGGEALYDRAVMEQMTRDEYIGSFYAWAPYPFGGPLRRALGYSRTDMEEGGRLQRLNESSDSSFARRDEAAELAARPQDTVTYYRRGRAEKMILLNQFVAAGNPEPELAADRELKKRAIAMIVKHPLRHVALTLSLLWRGGNFAFAPLAGAFIYAVRCRKRELALLVLPALALVLFYALLSSFETRYAMPTYPLVVCVLVALAAHLVRRCQVRSVGTAA